MSKRLHRHLVEQKWRNEGALDLLVRLVLFCVSRPFNPNSWCRWSGSIRCMLSQMSCRTCVHPSICEWLVVRCQRFYNLERGENTHTSSQEFFYCQNKYVCDPCSDSSVTFDTTRRDNHLDFTPLFSTPTTDSIRLSWWTQVRLDSFTSDRSS
jgi:hypothetical protein